LPAFATAFHLDLRTEDCAYNYNTLPGAAAEGYTQWLEVLDFITPKEVGITTHATTGPRPAPQPNRRPHCITLEQGRPVTSDQQGQICIASERKQEERRGGLEQPQHLSIPGQPGIILGFSLS